MKYIIDIPSSQEYSYDKDFKSLDLKFHDDNFSGMTRFDAEPYTEPDRETIENKVWELADYMCRMSQTEKNLCFGFSYPSEVTTNLSYQEAKSLFEKSLVRIILDEGFFCPCGTTPAGRYTVRIHRRAFGVHGSPGDWPAEPCTRRRTAPPGWPER